MRVVALFRVSSEKQGTEGTSLDTQERIYREMAAQRGWTTVAEFRGCESATQANSDRRVLQQVLQCIRDSAVDAVWVIEQSRLSRGDELEVALLMRELKERGIKVIVRETVRDLSSIDERFMVGIQSLVDRAESERIKERMLRGRRARAESGKKTAGPVPYGYRNPARHESGHGTLQVVEEQASVVRRIFALALEGKGAGRIAAELNRLGVPGIRGGRWFQNSVKGILHNMAYVGTAFANVWVGDRKTGVRFDPTNPKAIIRKNVHQPIVDQATWDAVNSRTKLPRTSMPKLLTGLLWIDGERAGGATNGGGPHYHGPRGIRNQAWLPVRETDDAVWSAFVSLATGPDFVQALMDAAATPHQRQVIAQEIDYITQQISRQRKRLDHLLELRMDDEVDRETYAAKKAEAEAAIAALQAELGDLRGKEAVLDGSSAPRVVRAVQTLLAGRSKLTTAQQRQILNTIVRRIDVVTERTGAARNRDSRGQIVKGRLGRWRIKSTTFRLALPAATAAEYAAHAGNCAGAGTTNAVEPTPSRSGQLTSTACSSASAPGS